MLLLYNCSSYLFAKFDLILVVLVAVNDAYAARGTGDGVNPQNVSVVNQHGKAEPVCSVHAAGGEEGDAGVDDALILRACHRSEALAHALRPGHAADQRIVQHAAIEVGAAR